MHLRKPALATLLSLALLSVNSTGAAAETNRLNGIAATVNESIITIYEVYSEVESQIPLLRRLYGASPARFREELGKLEAAFLRQLVERELVLSDFRESGYNIPESFIEDRLKEEISRYGDRVGFIKTLQAQGKTVEEFRQEFRDLLIYNIMSSQKVRQQITISPYKIERYYEENQDKFKVGDQVKLRLIELRKNSPDDPATVERAQNIREQLLAGASFGDLARANSTASSAKNDGLFGWTSLDDVNESIRNAARDLKPGEISELIENTSAIWIVKVDEAKTAHVKPLAEVRDQIEKDLLTEENVRRKKQWIDSIRAKSYVRTF